ncbi:MAG TPA: helix-turn-helix domain-containing protein [Flavisolibacter sp.]|nr:helix-turn-helix domain-containing protein [Flavisolibacter sp.]
MNNPFEKLENALQEINNHLLELKAYAQQKEINPSNNDEEMGGIELAARVTGLSKSTIYALSSKGAIPYHKAKGGKRIYFFKSELLDWIKRSK